MTKHLLVEKRRMKESIKKKQKNEKEKRKQTTKTTKKQKDVLINKEPLYKQIEEKRNHQSCLDERFQFNDALWNEVKKEESKKGVVYLSTIPFGLNASKIREIFSKYGSVLNIHLNKTKDEEMKINSKENNFRLKKYVDGYVEFDNKKDAMRIEKLLNNQMVGGKKRKNIIREHIWNIKYLKNFTWNTLVSSTIYRSISRKDKFQYALKNMYREYDKYLERHLKNGEDEKEHTSTNDPSICKKNSMCISKRGNITNKKYYRIDEGKKKDKTISSSLCKLF